MVDEHQYQRGFQTNLLAGLNPLSVGETHNFINAIVKNDGFNTISCTRSDNQTYLIRCKLPNKERWKP
jgi:hypothetical protein